MKRKVLYIVHADTSTGSGKCAQALIQELQSNDYFEPIVLTQFKNNINEFCNLHGIENYHIHYARTCCLGMGIIGWIIAFIMRPILNRLALKALSKKTNIQEITLIHTNDSSIDFGAFLYQKLKIPHIWHIREFLVFEKKIHPIVSNLPRYIEQNSTCIITVSNSLKYYLIKKGCCSSKIQTIYDGFNPNKFISDLSTPKLNGPMLSLVCVGAITPEKGQATLIDAIALLPKEYKCLIRIDFWGNIDKLQYKEILDEKINKANLQDCVSFKGFSSNIESQLSKYDVGIQPSHSEGFSLVTVEYMAAGLCVIAANEGAIPELITHNEVGLLYKDYDANDLKNQLIFCLDNLSFCKKMASNAQHKALDFFCLQKNIDQLIKIYQTL